MSKVAWTILAVTLAALAVAGAAAGAPAGPTGQTVELRLGKAAADTGSRDRAREEQGIRTCRDILTDPQATAAQKARATEISLEVLRRRKSFQEAIEAAEAGRIALSADPQAEERLFLVQVDIYREWGKKEEAVARAREFVQSHASDKRACGRAQLKMADLLLEMKRFQDCIDEASKAISPDDANATTEASALRLVQEAHWQGNDMEACLKVLGRLLEPRCLAATDVWVQQGYVQRYGDCLRRLKRSDEARAHYARWARDANDPRRAQQCGMWIAESFENENRLDEALQAYHRVFTDHPGVADAWGGTQWRIAEVLARQEKLDDAIRAKRICLDAATDSGGLTDNIRQIAEWLKRLDKDDIARANRFIEYQRLGPAGEDGNLGTADDLTDPLEEFGRPAYPDRDKAFAEARRTAGDDAAASRFRAMACIYAGRPREALRHYLDSVARTEALTESGRGGEFTRLVRETITVGVRAVRGHTAGLDVFYQFVTYGPAGPDGKMNTPDDIPDPFAPLLGEPPRSTGPAGLPDGDGGLAELTPEDVRILRQARQYLQRFAADQREQRYVRRDAIQSLQRIHEALNDWGAPGQLDWYLDLLGKASESDVRSALASAGQMAARARAYHLGAVHEYWRRLDVMAQDQPPAFLREIEHIRTAFDRAVTEVARVPRLVPNVKPFRPPPVKPPKTPPATPPKGRT
jgi:tetratricopeptide (TPR) repeat protein